MLNIELKNKFEIIRFRSPILRASPFTNIIVKTARQEDFRRVREKETEGK